MPVACDDLWSLTTGTPFIDPVDLACALEREANGNELDFRTQLLIRDGMSALKDYWGTEKFNQWLEASPSHNALVTISQSDLGLPGFPTLADRIMPKLQPQTVREFLRELGARISEPVRITVGGSIGLILTGELERKTEDIDIVDEVPLQIRSQHDLLHELARRYGLKVTHFQSHFLPTGWERRLHSLGRFGEIEVDLVDTYDTFVGKLFSARTKDRDDLRMLTRRLDPSKIEARLRDSASSLLAEPKLEENASKNWYILFGRGLPTDRC